MREQLSDLVFSLLLTGFGSAGLARHLRELIHALESRKWIMGEAVVIGAAVQERRGSRGRTLFEPTLAFRYEFGGREYFGHRIAFGEVAENTREEAEQSLSRFPVGAVR